MSPSIPAITPPAMAPVFLWAVPFVSSFTDEGIVVLRVLVIVVLPVLPTASEEVVASLIASVTLKLSSANTSWDAQGGMDVAEETGRGYLNEPSDDTIERCGQMLLTGDRTRYHYTLKNMLTTYQYRSIRRKLFQHSREAYRTVLAPWQIAQA